MIKKKINKDREKFSQSFKNKNNNKASIKRITTNS